MTELFLIKLGGSLITDKTKPFTANLKIIKQLAREIHEIREKYDIKLIVGHGGGSFPHTSAHKYQTQKGIVNKESYRGIAVVQNDASKLNRIIVDELIKAGENAISIQPSACCLTKKGRIIEWYLEPLKKILEYNMLPIPYGDVCVDLEQGCSIISTEEILSCLAKNLEAKKIIMCGKVDGVFSGQPNDSESKLIPEITPDNFENIKRYLSGSEGTDVTGGMILKVQQSLELAKLGFETQIINASIPGNLLRALKGERIGTIIRK